MLGHASALRQPSCGQPAPPALHGAGSSSSPSGISPVGHRDQKFPAALGALQAAHEEAEM